MSEVIYSYSRQDAIADGVLVDVSKLAEEAGFRIPVALTQAVWVKCVVVTEEVCDQDESGRLWDILVCLFFRIRRAQAGESLVRFQVAIRRSPHLIEDIDLVAVCGPGDNAEPVITIMFPEED